MTDDSLLVNKYRYEIYWILQGVGRLSSTVLIFDYTKYTGFYKGLVGQQSENPTSAGTKHTRLQLLVD